jgi:hypothetical protein
MMVGVDFDSDDFRAEHFQDGILIHYGRFHRAAGPAPVSFEMQQQRQFLFESDRFRFFK